MLFYCFVGKKIIDFLTQRDAGKKIKGGWGGGIQTKAAHLYTPLLPSPDQGVPC